MSNDELARLRAGNQGVGAGPCRTVREVVSRLGALQAQAFPMSKWAVGVRARGVTEEDVDSALARSKVVNAI